MVNFLRPPRRQNHALVADWLINAAQANGRSDEYTPLIGEHFQLAGKLEMVAGWYGRAGQQAIAAFAQDEAVRYLTFTLKFTPEENASDRFTLLPAREKAFGRPGRKNHPHNPIRTTIHPSPCHPVTRCGEAIGTTAVMPIASH